MSCSVSTCRLVYFVVFFSSLLPSNNFTLYCLRCEHAVDNVFPDTCFRLLGFQDIYPQVLLMRCTRPLRSLRLAGLFQINPLFRWDFNWSLRVQEQLPLRLFLCQRSRGLIRHPPSFDVFRAKKSPHTNDHSQRSPSNQESTPSGGNPRHLHALLA